MVFKKLYGLNLVQYMLCAAGNYQHHRLGIEIGKRILVVLLYVKH
jgi:hypothetical protein